MLRECTTPLQLVEERTELRTYLKTIVPRLVRRFRRAFAVLDAQDGVGLSITGVDISEAILHGLEREDWTPLKNLVPDENDEDAKIHQHVMRYLISYMLDQVENESALALPNFSPLLGLLRVRFATLKRQLANNQLRLLGLNEQDFDPVDMAIDHVIASLDAKDPATGEHSRAVSAWCTRLSVRMELGDEVTVKVTRGGLVHDIGKTTTPLEILTAPRRLSDEERMIMQHHVVAGWEMIEQIPPLHPFSSIVRHHHEKYQGGGYPDALTADEIPLETRIVTVADSFNAMIGRRPYRVPLSPLGAVDELRRHRSGQFDPDVTDAMVEIVLEMVENGTFMV